MSSQKHAFVIELKTVLLFPPPNTVNHLPFTFGHVQYMTTFFKCSQGRVTLTR